MSRYRVFLEAPTATELASVNAEQAYKWQTVTSTMQSFKQPMRYTVPPATLEAASRRISKLYETIIFDDDDSELIDEDSRCDSEGQTSIRDSGWTSITWPPTANNTAGVDVTHNRVDGTFLQPSASLSRRQIETQETQDTNSMNYSDASSVAHFPSYHFNLHILTPLSSLRRHSTRPSADRAYDPERDSSAHKKLNVLVAVLEVEGPDTIRIKKGPDAGREVSILKLIVGDEDAVCKLTAWREVAERWGGSYASEEGIKRGDIVLFQNVQPSNVSAGLASDGVALTASPALSSSVQICFRTMPLGHEQDSRYRPDLRLGYSDATVRKVAAVVSWFENMAGLPKS